MKAFQALWMALLLLPGAASADEQEPFRTFVEGSEEAKLVLRAANEATLEELKSSSGLDVRAAENLIDYRNGDDGASGTDDDEFYSNLEEVLDLPFVRHAELVKLHKYAQVRFAPNSAGDPFHEASCTGTPLTAADLEKWIPLPHENARPLGTFRAHARRRYCFKNGLCREWESSLDKLQWIPVVFTWRNDEIYNQGIAGKEWLSLPPMHGDVLLELRGDAPRLSLVGSPNEKKMRFYSFNRLDPKRAKMSGLAFVSEVEKPEEYLSLGRDSRRGFALPGLNYFAFDSLLVTAKCLRYTNAWKEPFTDDKQNAVYWEHQFVVLGTLTPPPAE